MLTQNAYEETALRQERQRLATYGGFVLSDRELLALLVDTGAVTGCDAYTLVGQLLARFGSVSAIGRAHLGELASVPGLGEAGAARLAAAFELDRRANVEQPPIAITTPEDLVQASRPMLLGQTRERLVVVICNRANQVIGHEVLSQGSADRSLLPVREAMVAVLRRDGQRLALAHNHPSGDPTPSRDDIEETAKVRRAAMALGVGFLWHVVVTETAWRAVAHVGSGRRGQRSSSSYRT